MFFTNYVKMCNSYVNPDGTVGISPSAAAEAMGFQRSQITRWKTTTEPRMSTLLKMTDFFGCTVEDLTGGKTEEQPPDDGELSKDEREVIRLFRNADSATRLAMLHLLRLAEAQESARDADAPNK